MLASGAEERGCCGGHNYLDAKLWLKCVAGSLVLKSCVREKFLTVRLTFIFKFSKQTHQTDHGATKAHTQSISGRLHGDIITDDQNAMLVVCLLLTV